MVQHKQVETFSGSTCWGSGLWGVFFTASIFLTSSCSEKHEQKPSKGSSPTYEAHVPLIVQDTASWPSTFGFGRPAHASEIAALDIDIRPDGTGLPPGSGDAVSGKALYATKCAACHGATGTEGPNDAVIGPVSAHALPFGRDLKRVKTIGNYWPYATTVFDYIRRAMPYNAPGSLSDEEVYRLTAFLLYANKIIDSTEIMNARTLPRVKMPAQSFFVEDDRRGGAEVR